MKPTVFYTLFFGIFLAGGLAGQEPRLVLPVGHSSYIITASFSPDGKKIATISQDNTAKIWDAASGKLLVDLRAHTDEIVSVEFSPDGKKILTASKDSTAKIWDVFTGSLVAVLKGHSNRVVFAGFKSDGSKIITGSTDFTAKLWDANSGKLLLDLTGHKGFISSAEFSPDGNRIITSSGDATVRLWDAASGKMLFEIKGHNDVLYCAKFNPAGETILTGSQDNTVKMWDATSGDFLYELQKGSICDFSQVFSPDGSKMVTRSKEQNGKIWDAKSGKLLLELQGHKAALISIKFSSDGKKVITTSKDNTIKIWDAVTGNLLLNIREKLNKIEFATLSPDGKRVVAANTRDNVVNAWNAVTGKFLFDLKGHNAAIYSSEFSPDGRKIITLEDNGFLEESFTGDYEVRIWDAARGTLLFDLRNNNSPAESVSCSPDGKTMFVVYKDGHTNIWDINSGKSLVNLKGATNGVFNAQFSLDGKKIITVSNDSTVKIWDAKTGGLITGLKRNKHSRINNARFSPDGKKVVITSNRGISTIWNATTGDSLVEIKVSPNTIAVAQFSPDGKEIITEGHRDNTVKIWNATTGRLLYRGIESNYSMRSVAFMPGGGRFTTIASRYIVVWDYVKGGVIKSLEGHTQRINTINYSASGKLLVSASDDKTVKIWSMSSYKLLNSLQHGAEVSSASFSPDETRIITTSSDNSMKIWDVATGNLLYSLLTLYGKDYVIQTTAGYYQITSSAAKLLHYVTKDLKVISFEQLDVKYNRPDKVLEAIGNSDTALIKSYRKAWEKRIKKLGIDTTQFREGYSVPECDFVNRDQIEAEQKTEMLQLHIKAGDSTYRLDRFNIWVNESPLFGQRGISIRKKNSNTLDTIITIKLSQGENRIECSITNVNGTESYRMPLYVNYTPAVKQKESLRFIGIGIDRFSEKGHDLQYSVKDIRDLSAKLKEKYGKDIQIDTLFNENVNSSNVSALKKQLQQTSVNDKVILAYSGHGLLSKDYDYYLSSFTVNFSKPEQNGLPYEELENLLDSIPARRKLMLIDACHSGEVDKEEMTRITGATDTLSQQGTKGGKPTYTGKTTLGMKNSFELMQSLFVNVGKSTGATVISAAAGTQFALERGDLRNGVFTYSILEAMSKYPSIKISELRKFVGERVEKLTNGLQKPTSRNETIVSDWTL